VLLPYNFAVMGDDGYRAAFDELLALCAARNVAVQTIKSVARRRWRDDSEPHFSWYQPLPAGPALERAVAYVLGRPSLFLLSSSDARLLPAILDAAETPASTPSVEDLTADAAREGIEPLFDGGALERI
jgi:hypothetical protein